MIKADNNPSPVSGKKIWTGLTLVLISSDDITKGPHSTKEALLMPTHTNGGLHYSKSNNNISTLGHYVS